MNELMNRTIRQLVKALGTVGGAALPIEETIAWDYLARTGVRVAVSSVRCLVERLFRLGVASGEGRLDRSAARLTREGAKLLCEAITGTIWIAPDGSRWLVWEVGHGMSESDCPVDTTGELSDGSASPVLLLRGLKLNVPELREEPQVRRIVSLVELLRHYTWPTSGKQVRAEAVHAQLVL